MEVPKLWMSKIEIKVHSRGEISKLIRRAHQQRKGAILSNKHASKGAVMRAYMSGVIQPLSSPVRSSCNAMSLSPPRRR